MTARAGERGHAVTAPAPTSRRPPACPNAFEQNNGGLFIRIMRDQFAAADLPTATDPYLYLH